MEVAEYKSGWFESEYFSWKVIVLVDNWLSWVKIDFVDNKGDVMVD